MADIRTLQPGDGLTIEDEPATQTLRVKFGPASASFLPFSWTAAYNAASVGRKLQQTVCPLDAGATGDGVVDDTAAVTSVATAAPGRLVNGAGKTFRVAALPAGWRMLDGAIEHSATVNYTDKYSVIALGPGSLANNQFVPEVHASSYPAPFTMWASGNHLVAIGGGALGENTTGRRNTAVGSRSLAGCTTGYYNTAGGSHSMEKLTTGHENAAWGVQALNSVTSGSGNSGFGTTALTNLTTGDNNTAVGNLAGTYATTCYRTTLFGYRAGFANNADDLTAFGADAAVSNTTGGQVCAFGVNALLNNVTGARKVAMGWSAGRLSTADDVALVGDQAAYNATTATALTAVGPKAAFSLTTGNNVTAVGHQAALATTTGFNLAVVGRAAFSANVGGANAAIVGDSAAAASVSGDRISALGYAALPTANGFSNITGLGADADVTGSNQVQLGNSSTTTYAYGSVQNRSDARDKADVRPTALGVDFVVGLGRIARDWRWDFREDYGVGRERDGSLKRRRFHHGFVAQEVAQLCEQLGVDFGGLQHHAVAGGRDVWSLGYDELIGPMARTIAELHDMVAELRAEVAALKGAA